MPKIQTTIKKMKNQYIKHSQEWWHGVHTGELTLDEADSVIKKLKSVMREFISLDQSAYDSDNLRFEFKKQQEKFKGML